MYRYSVRLFFLIIACMAFCSFPVFGEDEMFQDAAIGSEIDFEGGLEPLYISLGSICEPAKQLREKGLRKGAFPFDWMLSVNGDKLIEILEDDFTYFLDSRYLVPFVNNKVLLNTYYQLEFSHEGEWKKPYPYFQYTKLRAKYARRIERFRKIKKYKGPVYFFRQSWPLSTHPNYAFSHIANLEISEDYARRLFYALQRYFPKVDIRLIVINKNGGANHSRKYIDNAIVILPYSVSSIEDIPGLFSDTQ